MKKLLIGFLLLAGCGRFEVAQQPPVSVPAAPNPFRIWSCVFEGPGSFMSATQSFRIDLTAMQYGVTADFNEELCDSLNSPACNPFLGVRAHFDADGLAHITHSDDLSGSGFQPVPPGQPNPVTYQITETELKLIDPSGQPNFGDLICTETL